MGSGGGGGWGREGERGKRLSRRAATCHGGNNTPSNLSSCDVETCWRCVTALSSSSTPSALLWCTVHLLYIILTSAFGVICRGNIALSSNHERNRPLHDSVARGNEKQSKSAVKANANGGVLRDVRVAIFNVLF